MSAHEMEVMVDQDGRSWMVRVINAVTVQSFSCATEEMARRFAEVFARSMPVARAA